MQLTFDSVTESKKWEKMKKTEEKVKIEKKKKKNRRHVQPQISDVS